jgi:hypothetical protein
MSRPASNVIRMKCTYCRGTGLMQWGFRLVPCSFCGGTGIMPELTDEDYDSFEKDPRKEPKS